MYDPLAYSIKHLLGVTAWQYSIYPKKSKEFLLTSFVQSNQSLNLIKLISMSFLIKMKILDLILKIITLLKRRLNLYRPVNFKPIDFKIDQV